MKKYDIECSCGYVGKSSLKKQCRKCYYAEYKHRAPKKECLGCGEQRSGIAKGYCHKCYEFNRRQKLIEEAKTCPVKAERLKVQRHNEYTKAKERGHYKKLSRRLDSALRAYKGRDPESNLDKEWFLDNIVDKNCVYCGIDEATAKEVTGNNLHVDRKIPEKGYKKDNCIPACKACNTAKLNIWTFEETCELGKIIAKFYETRRDNKDE